MTSCPSFVVRGVFLLSFEHVTQFVVCKQKLESKKEALLILSKELDTCQQERDQYKLMANQLRERHQGLKKKYSELIVSRMFEQSVRESVLSYCLLLLLFAHLISAEPFDLSDRMEILLCLLRNANKCVDFNLFFLHCLIIICNYEVLCEALLTRLMFH